MVLECHRDTSAKAGAVTHARTELLGSCPGSQTPGWNEQAEVAALVILAVAQIEAALSEAERSVRALGSAFVSIANAIEPIAELVLTSDGRSGRLIDPRLRCSPTISGAPSWPCSSTTG
jgi:hypothetical protein